MVTLPTEAATDPSLSQALVEHGVECIRINCAHDSQAVWEAMIANVYRTEQVTSRTERVRVQMEGLHHHYERRAARCQVRQPAA
jgi:pyruvate kinase